jgi:arylformamidase
VHLVGVDFPSVDRAPFLTHVALLSHNVLILENLTNLSEIRAGSFRLVAIPLKITGRDGSPVRAIALQTA